MGNSTKSRPNPTNKPKGNSNRRRRRRPSNNDELPNDDDSCLEVISPEQLELSKDIMNLSELKNRQAADLVDLGLTLGIENMARQRKQA